MNGKHLKVTYNPTPNADSEKFREVTQKICNLADALNQNVAVDWNCLKHEGVQIDQLTKPAIDTNPRTPLEKASALLTQMRNATKSYKTINLLHQSTHDFRNALLNLEEPRHNENHFNFHCSHMHRSLIMIIA